MNATNRSRNSGVSSGRAVITSEFCWDPAIPRLSCGPVEHRPANEAPRAMLGWLSWAQCASRQQRQFNIYNLIWPLNIFSLFLSFLARHGGTALITWKVPGSWRHLEELCRWWSRLKERASTLPLVFQQWEKAGIGWIRMPGNSIALARVEFAVIASGIFTQICSGLCCPGKCPCWCFRKKFWKQFPTTGQFIYTKKDSGNEKITLWGEISIKSNF